MRGGADVQRGRDSFTDLTRAVSGKDSRPPSGHTDRPKSELGLGAFSIESEPSTGTCRLYVIQIKRKRCFLSSEGSPDLRTVKKEKEVC